METNDIELDLIQALNKVDSNLKLSKILQTQRTVKNEPITVTFKWGDEILLICQRDIESSVAQCRWSQVNRESLEVLEEKRLSANIGQNIAEVLSEDRESLEVLEEKRLSANIGQNIAEVLSEAGMLPAFKNALLKRNLTISESKPVNVQFNFNNGLTVVLKCPCTPRPCCQVAV